MSLKKHPHKLLNVLTALFMANTLSMSHASRIDEDDLTESFKANPQAIYALQKPLAVAETDVQNGITKNNEALSVLTTADLPPEIVHKVFSYLSSRDVRSAANTCRYWREITRSFDLYVPKLVHSTLSYEEIFSDHSKAPESSNRPQPNITHLVIDQQTRDVEKIDLNQLVQRLPYLRSLKMINAKISAPQFSAEEAKPQSAKLESLELIGCEIVPHGTQANINEAKSAVGSFLSHLVLSSGHFREFKLEKMPGFFSQHFLATVNNDHLIENPVLSSLERLEIIGDGFLKSIPGYVLRMNNLRVLRITHAQIESVSETPLDTLAHPKLELLDLSHNHSTSPQKFVASVVPKFSTVTTLNLRNTGLTALDDATLAPLTNLTSLNVSENARLSDLPPSLRNLGSLKEIIANDTLIRSIADDFSNSVQHITLVSQDHTPLPHEAEAQEKAQTTHPQRLWHVFTDTVLKPLLQTMFS